MVQTEKILHINKPSIAVFVGVGLPEPADQGAQILINHFHRIS